MSSQVSRVSRDSVMSSDIWRELGVAMLLLYLDMGQFRHRQVRSRTGWRAREQLGIPQEELESVTGERNLHNLSLDIQKTMDGWTFYSACWLDYKPGESLMKTGLRIWPGRPLPGSSNEVNCVKSLSNLESMGIKVLDSFIGTSTFSLFVYSHHNFGLKLNFNKGFKIS